jgi:non-specific serine/threonine protein kinase
LRLAEGIEPSINTSARQTSLSVLEREHSNLRIVLERTARDGAGDRASRLASALFWFWFHRGHWREGRTFLSAAIERDRRLAPSRARALLGDGVLAWTEGDLGAAGLRLEEAAALGRTIDDLPTAAHALHFLAMVRLGEGDAAAGRSLGEQAVALARTAADAFCLTIALASDGVVLLALEHYDDARAALEESVARGRERGDAWAVALPLRNLAILAYRQQDHRTARTLLEESLHGLRAMGEKWFLSRTMETLAEVMAAAGEYERAAHLFGAAETLREAVGASVLAFYRADYERAMSMARTALGQERFESCWTAGRALSLDEAVAYALGELCPPIQR